MKTLPLILVVLTALVAGLLLVPAFQGAISVFAVLIGGLSIATAILISKTGSAPAPRPAEPAPAAAPVPAPAASTAEAEIVAFLGLFQEKGRLLDFLMEDLTSYSDDQVGAAARVIHQGCKEVIKEHFKIAPVSAAEEGSEITVPEGDEAAQFRVVGKIAGDPPFKGTLVHKGWATESVKLPRVIPGKSDRLPVIAPAQVELR